MARLHEYQGKALLAEAGFTVPRGEVVASAEEGVAATKKILDHGANGVVLKIQAWTTGRKALGGVAFAKTVEDAQKETARLLDMKVGNFPVEQVLIEEQIAIRDELFVSFSIDDAARQPVMLLSLEGGSGIEERAANVHRIPIDAVEGFDEPALRDVIRSSSIDAEFHDAIYQAGASVWKTAKQ